MYANYDQINLNDEAIKIQVTLAVTIVITIAYRNKWFAFWSS